MYCSSDIDYFARHVFVVVEFLRMVEAVYQDFMSLNTALVSLTLIRTAAYMQVVQC
jgi:phenylalanine-4-hydroxylase